MFIQSQKFQKTVYKNDFRKQKTPLYWPGNMERKQRKRDKRNYFGKQGAQTKSNVEKIQKLKAKLNPTIQLCQTYFVKQHQQLAEFNRRFYEQSQKDLLQKPREKKNVFKTRKKYKMENLNKSFDLSQRNQANAKRERKLKYINKQLNELNSILDIDSTRKGLQSMIKDKLNLDSKSTDQSIIEGEFETKYTKFEKLRDQVEKSENKSYLHKEQDYKKYKMLIKDKICLKQFSKIDFRSRQNSFDEYRDKILSKNKFPQKIQTKTQNLSYIKENKLKQEIKLYNCMREVYDKEFQKFCNNNQYFGIGDPQKKIKKYIALDIKNSKSYYLQKEKKKIYKQIKNKGLNDLQRKQIIKKLYYSYQIKTSNIKPAFANEMLMFLAKIKDYCKYVIKKKTSYLNKIAIKNKDIMEKVKYKKENCRIF